jgi:hypothetical protein
LAVLAGIAGPRFLASITLLLPISTLDGSHPRDKHDVVGSVRDAVERLRAQVG